MSNEISPDVEYLINQLNEIQNNIDQLEISYQDKNVAGLKLTKEETQEKPQILIKKQVEDNKFLTLVMIDPDAPSSDNPITGPFIHWINANFTHNNAENGQNICDYMGPGPRPGTGTHRYIFLLYQSKEQIKQDQIFDSIPQRRKFPLLKFVEDNHLQLIDGTFFTVEA